MTFKHKHLIAIKQNFKSIILFCLIIISVTISGYAQSSGLQIATSGEIDSRQIVDGRISGIVGSIASLRKTVVNTALNQLTPEQLRNPLSSTKQTAVKEKDPKGKIAEEKTRKEISTKEADSKVTTETEKNKEALYPTEVKQKSSINMLDIPPNTTITSATIYDITGATAIPSRQYTSLQASFVFLFYNRNTGIQNPVGLIELYKLEKGGNTRSFCIPSGGCASVNIPIQITANGQPVTAGSSVSTRFNSYYTVVLPNGGYLQPGEYAFIDKSSLTRDGASLVCFAFTVKQ